MAPSVEADIAPRRSPKEEAALVERIDRFFGLRPLVPLFPVNGFTPESPCPHHGPLPEGSALCCMACHKSGMDDHPAIRRDRRFDPRPDDPALMAVALEASRDARRERRIARSSSGR